MKILPFTLLGATQYESLRASFCSDVEKWLADWFTQPPTAMLTLAPIAECFNDHRQTRGISFTDPCGEQWAVCVSDKATCQGLGAMLLCGRNVSAPWSQPTDIASGLVRSALLDLIEHLLPSSQGDYIIAEKDAIGACIPAGAFKPGKEALHLKIDLGGVGLHVWVPVLPFLSRIDFPSPTLEIKEDELAKPRDALASQRMAFQVILGGAELALGSIANLKVGDVIRLDKDLQDPLSLIFANSPVKFSGYLGKLNERFAFQIEALLKQSEPK